MNNWRYFGVKLFRISCYQLVSYEQNGLLVIDIIVPFYTQSDLLEHLAWNYEYSALPLSYAARK